MSPTRYTPFSLLAMLLLFWGCTGVQQTLDEAQEYRQQGAHEEAAELYARILLEHPENQAARSGLRDAAQKVLNDKLERFDRLAGAGSRAEAYDAYRDAMSYRESITRGTSAELSVASQFSDSFQETKRALAEEHYRAGRQALADGAFQSAVESLERAQSLISGYRDTSRLLSRARNDQLQREVKQAYEQGVQAFEVGDYRRAYGFLRECTKKIPGYKDASSLQEQALDRGEARERPSGDGTLRLMGAYS